MGVVLVMVVDDTLPTASNFRFGLPLGLGISFVPVLADDDMAWIGVVAVHVDVSLLVHEASRFPIVTMMLPCCDLCFGFTWYVSVSFYLKSSSAVQYRRWRWLHMNNYDRWGIQQQLMICRGPPHVPTPLALLTRPGRNSGGCHCAAQKTGRYEAHLQRLSPCRFCDDGGGQRFQVPIAVLW